MEEQDKQNIARQIEIVDQVRKRIGYAEYKIEEEIDNMDHGVVAMLGIAIFNFANRINNLIEKKLEENADSRKIKEQHIAESENSGLSMN